MRTKQMKKVMSLLALAALLLSGCAKERNRVDEVSFLARIAGGEETKAQADNDGLGANATRCILELYYADELYYRAQTTVTGKVAAFENIPLVSNRTYDVLFWADAGEAFYDASDLRNVRMVSTEYAANDDRRDAFFYCGQQTVEQRGESYEAQLRRPFAQVNVITTDASVVKTASLYPDNVEMSYTAPTRFNLLSGELGEAKAITCSGNAYAAFDASSSALTLQMDYIFAPVEKSAIDITFKTGQSTRTDVRFELTNIPYQRNYRTNVLGNFLSTNGKWEVTVVPAWTADDFNERFAGEGNF